MVMNEPIAELASAPTLHRAPLVALDGDFETRWAAWVARGTLHDRRVRRRFVVSAAVMATVGAIMLAFLA